MNSSKNYFFLHFWIVLLRSNFVCCKSQSIWYPLWITKDQGTDNKQNIKIGSNIYHIPITPTDSPVYVNLLPGTTKLCPSKFPNKIDFLLLKNHQCLLKIPRKREGNVYKRRFVGITDGIFPHPEDKNKFVVCYKRKAGNIDCLEVNCPKGTHFDAESRKLKMIGKQYYKNRGNANKQIIS